MNPTKFIKATATLVVGAATTSVVRQIITQQVNPVKTTDKVAVVIGSFVLATIVSDVAKLWTGAKIDQGIATLKKFTKDVKDETNTEEV